MTEIGQILLLSLWIAACSTVLVVIIGIALSYLFVFSDSRKWLWLDTLVAIPLVLPPTVVGFLLIYLLGKRGPLGVLLEHFFGITLLFTWQAAVIAALVVSLPLMIRVTRSGFLAVDRELILASQSLGKSSWISFRRIIMPLARNSIVAGALLSFTRALGEFGATLMVAGNIPGKTATLSLSIYTAFESGDMPSAWIMALLLTTIAVFAMVATHLLTRSRW
ncbi:MAG: molybdenum ABC transporter permease subunit [Ferrovum sp. 37-45-19]|uniref:molybdate ABC transporter permease subunit n=1 Tax=Ferrovum sp. JA12 TaxID=1356299 RepID=UPI000702680C|nr:molybdate ABC transporter permease subunit [Ferrovum sp. JA12]OYV79481.1 MAG: molybdenum ABC transporter permease subunit [Ferrovum sp. 21-44-67]OYV94224.1 MAG: molybdenum ABC transporter permease subunit [Ferrovum sp. 37-45-19]HQT81698.1 molybdate ABC transporter permease subunit [Ferrovaceae bacterium]KRH78362.1 molybdenum transport system permease protein ModB [Ferrovum sp. JA12]HQU07000.1 molybdate ABC transporter permease subunit [Ferrovaceae bacterium]